MKRALLTIAIMLAIAAAAWKVTGIVQETERNTRAVAALALEAHALTTSLQRAVVESCEETGNARAKVQRETLEEEIEEAKHPDPEAFKALVEAGVSEIAILRSEQKAIAKFERRLERVKLVNCAQHYHISPGSGQSRRGSGT